MNSFDLLPTDVKLHIFSFLNTKSVIAITAANKDNNQLKTHKKFWQQRALVEFGELPPIDQDAKAHYLALHQQYVNEYHCVKLMWVLAAFLEGNGHPFEPIRNLFNVPAFNNIDYLQDFMQLHRSLIIYSRTTVIQQAQKMICKHLTNAGQTFDFDQMNRIFTKSNLDEVIHDQEILTDELYTYCDFDARLHLRELIRHAPKALLTSIVRDPEHGAKLFFMALRFGNVEMINALLALGLNPNHIQCRDRSNYYRPLDVVMIDLRSCYGIMTSIIKSAASEEVEYLLNYYLHRITCFEEIFKSLLKYGANPDSLSANENIRMESPRTHCETWLREFDAHNEQTVANNTMLVATKRVLTIIIESPKPENREAQESLTKRLRV